MPRPVQRLAHTVEVGEVLSLQLGVDHVFGVAHLRLGVQAEALDALTTQLELEPPQVQSGVEAVPVLSGE